MCELKRHTYFASVHFMQILAERMRMSAVFVGFRFNNHSLCKHTPICMHEVVDIVIVSM